MDLANYTYHMIKVVQEDYRQLKRKTTSHQKNMKKIKGSSGRKS